MQEQEVQFAELNEVPFRDLKIGDNYLIQDSSYGDEGRRGMWSFGVRGPPSRGAEFGVNPENSLRAKGIKYLGPKNFSFDEHTVEKESWMGPSRKAREGINFGNIDISQLSEGDPLVRFESIEPLSGFTRSTGRGRCVICDVTHLKPINEGENQRIGYKFYKNTQDELDRRTDALRLRDTLPDGLEQNMKEIISEELFGATPGSLKNWRHINTRNRNHLAEKRRLLAAAAEKRRRQKSGIGGYKNNLKNKKKSKKNKKNKKYNRNKATMKIKQKNKRKTRTKKMWTQQDVASKKTT